MSRMSRVPRAFKPTWHLTDFVQKQKRKACVRGYGLNNTQRPYQYWPNGNDNNRHKNQWQLLSEKKKNKKLQTDYNAKWCMQNANPIEWQTVIIINRYLVISVLIRVLILCPSINFVNFVIASMVHDRISGQDFGLHLIAVNAWPDILVMARNEFKAELAQ